MNSSFSRSSSDRYLDRASHCSGLLEVELSEAIRRARLIDFETQRQFVQTQSWRKRCAITLLNFFTGQQQIAIQPKYTDGRLQWTVYDPQTNVVNPFNSEQAVRTWLEQRHQR